MLQDMYKYAVDNNADIVWADWYISMAGGERYMSMPDFQTPQEAVKAMLGGGMKYNVWNKLARRSLYVDNDISFPDGYGMGEDLTMIKLLHSLTMSSIFPEPITITIRLIHRHSVRHILTVIWLNCVIMLMNY